MCFWIRRRGGNCRSKWHRQNWALVRHGAVVCAPGGAPRCYLRWPESARTFVLVSALDCILGAILIGFRSIWFPLQFLRQEKGWHMQSERETAATIDLHFGRAISSEKKLCVPGKLSTMASSFVWGLYTNASVYISGVCTPYHYILMSNCWHVRAQLPVLLFLANLFLRMLKWRNKVWAWPKTTASVLLFLHMA